MLPALIDKVLGQNWKTSLCGLLFLVAGFIAATPQYFARWPIVTAIANYVLVGAGAAGLRAARDSKKTP